MFKSSILLLVTLMSLFELGLGQSCTQEGFFRNPSDCTKFYRCVDIWQNGRQLQIYHFDCPVGTVFDETVSVCNWPAAAAPCDGQAPAPIEPVAPVAPIDDGEDVILKPSFSYQCTGEGLFPHATDCAKFWLCEDETRSILEGQLFVCPDGYLFDDSKLRCLKQEIVSCTNKPEEAATTRREPLATRLSVSELDSFFARWGGPNILEV